MNLARYPNYNDSDAAWLAGLDHWYKIDSNKTRQGYARKRTLKLAGYSFVGCTA